ncbi:matrix metalloproteinase-19 [Aedes albopictus]|uniref:Peptidase metallopeptidase domain-containing protein n=1 Tax=Aedes albopictus TaxID=7160 RepID=A0ABM1Y4W9_AEDAL|nr:matrix metalloproteinase-19-like [Aedes albopictus]
MMELLAVLAIFLCVFSFSLAFPTINPESIFIPLVHRVRDDVSDVFQADSNEFPTDPRVPPVVTDQDAQAVLQDYGFLSSDDIINRLDQTTDSAKDALKRFQKQFNLTENGALDDDTRRLISAPRCGVAELNAIEDKWTKRALTFKINSFPRSVPQSEARNLINQAFKEWTKHVLLNVTEVSRGEADIYVSDEQKIHENRLGSECRFTTNTTLAHAFFPEVGDIHYNTDRSYTSEEFFSATIHEIGHTLGLDHSNSKTSIMFPFHIRYHTEIPEEDRRALQALYGVSRTTTAIPTVPPRTETPVPPLCSLHKFDAILNDARGQTYALAGDYYYPLRDRTPRGRRISSKWPKLPGSVDVAFTYRNNKTFFFKRNRVWVYADNQLEAGYPKPIEDDFPGLPGNLGAVFVTKQGNLLALRKKHYWFYSPRKRPQIGKEFPRSVFDFQGMPVNVDAALRHTDGLAYFFKGRNYHILNMTDYTMGPATPMKRRWFAC